MDAASSKRRRAYFPEKVCFVCTVLGDKLDYYVFIRDLSKGGNVESLLPLVRLESAASLPICGIDSTVFMVEDIFLNDLSPNHSIQPVYYLDLEYLNKPNKSLNLKCGDLRKLPPMAAAKDRAVITRVPNSKRFLVFSTLLSSVGKCVTGDVKGEGVLNDDPSAGVPVDFEMYDVDAESWISLPRLCLRMASRRRRSSHGVLQLYDPVTRCWNRVMRLTEEDWPLDSFYISCFTFIDDITFVVQTDLGFMLRLDLASLGQGWKVYKEGCVASDDKVFVISGRSFGATWCASDVEVGVDMEDELKLPLSSFDVPTEKPPGVRVCRLERKGYLCALQTAVRKSNGYPQMVIDVVDDEVKRVASFRSELREEHLLAFPSYIFQYHPTYSQGSTLLV